MNKDTKLEILIIGGGIALAGTLFASGIDFSYLDSGRSRKDANIYASDKTAPDSRTISNDSYNVDLGRFVEGEQLKKALSSSAQDLGWRISFRDVFEKSYALEPVEERLKPKWTDVDVSIRPDYGLQLIIHEDDPLFKGQPRQASLYVTSGRDEEVKKYLGRLSHHLKKE